MEAIPLATRSFRSVTLILVALLLANVALSSSAATQEGGPNLLVNGDFEAGDTGWTVPPDPGGRFEVIPDPDSPGSVARLTAEGFSMLQASQDFEIAPNTEYRLTARGCCTGEGYLSAGVALFWSPLGSRRYDSLDAESPGWQDLDTGWVYPGPDSTTLSAVLALENEGSPDVQPILLDDVVLQARPRAGPTPTPTPDREPNIYLNEVMHRAGERDWNGDGVVNFEDPWIEIYREPIGTQPVNLEGWFLDDGPGGSERFRLVGSTNIDNYAVLHTAYTRINLARNDLVLQLYRPDGSLADEAAFPLAAPDLSAGRFPDGTGGVTLEHAPTYLAANGSLGPAPRPEPRDMTIAEARALNSEDPIRIRGAVTAPPNLVGPKRMYVQDETAGILVLVTEDAPAIPQGSVVEVTGLAQTYFGEVALRPEDGGIVPSSEAVPQPEPARVQTGSIDAYTEGSLVTLRGRVASTSKPSVQVDDGSGEARVTLPESAAIPWPSPQSEDTLTAAGVVSSFNGSYQVLVRYAPDVTIERPPPPQPRDVTIREARTAPDDELLRVEGVVTAPPGALGEGRMYLQDASGGILVAGLPAAVALGSGDRVRLTGTAGASQGERLLRPRSPEDIARVGAGAPLPPTRVDLGAVGADTEGVLVEVEGTIATASWPSLYLDHAGEDVRVYASATARLQNPEARRGDRLRAAGVVSGRAGRYRVLPYLQAQLAVTRVEPPPEHRRASVAEARIAPDGAKLLVEAVVTAPPGALASRQMHIQDSTAGILVTLPEGAPSLAPGDVAQVRGEAGSHFGQRALRAEDGGVSLLRHGAPPAPRTLRSLEVGPATEGLLARVQGAVTGSGRPVIRVDDGIGEARVRLAEAAQIPWPSPERGDTLLATGIVGSHTGAYHLLPRTAGDLSLRRPPPPAPRRVSVREARAAADDALLEVEAVVTAPPGVLGRSRVYAQDSTGGIMVTGVGDASGLRGGDRVRLIGRAAP
jgi:DNA/RNA endonuclease YhcR with UshA esterase domain